MTVFAGPRFLFGGEPTPGWIEIQGDRITQTGLGGYPGSADFAVDAIVAPGFVDVHCHGGGGCAFTEATSAPQLGDPKVALEQARRPPAPNPTPTAILTHRSRGTTTLIASLVTATWTELQSQIRALRPYVMIGELAGVHLEGPWLAPAKKGAHDITKLAPPDENWVDNVIACADVVKMVTIAPELPGALPAIPRLVAAGIVCAIGHTDADYATTQRAIDLGAIGGTHLFNAMPSLLHREPGPILALLRDSRTYCEFVVDGVHVHPDLAAWLIIQLGSRAVLVTDAMAATGLGDGAYDLGGLAVTVIDGVARLTEGGNIAGSTITLADAIKQAIAHGVPLSQAVAAATKNPANYLGLADVGRLAPGYLANLVVMDDQATVLGTMLHGVWQP